MIQMLRQSIGRRWTKDKPSVNPKRSKRGLWLCYHFINFQSHYSRNMFIQLMFIGIIVDYCYGLCFLLIPQALLMWLIWEIWTILQSSKSPVVKLMSGDKATNNNKLYKSRQKDLDVAIFFGEIQSIPWATVTTNW